MSSVEETPSTEEGRCVQIADRIAYVNHDIDDAIRGGVLKPQDLPAEAIEVLGQTHGKRINTLVNAVIAESLEKGRVSLSGDCLEALDVLRQFLFDHVYIDSPAKKEEDKAKSRRSFVPLLLKSPGEDPRLLRLHNRNRSQGLRLRFRDDRPFRHCPVPARVCPSTWGSILPDGERDSL